MTLEEIKKVAMPACREFKVKKLDLFGSLARGEATAASDVDLLVEFEEPDLHLSKRFFGLLHHLEDTLGREVDLLTVNSLRNPYLRHRVLKERMNIYLYDIKEAAAAILRFVRGKTFDDYEQDQQRSMGSSLESCVRSLAEQRRAGATAYSRA